MRRVLRLAGKILTSFFILSVVVTAIYRFAPPPLTILMIDRWLRGDDVHRLWVPLNEISAHLPLAVIAAEDAKFCLHHGFDWTAISVAFDRNGRSTRLRGGSTITQQLTKNVYLWPYRDYVRKAVEAYFTVLTELAWPKARIIEVYLNVVEWGGGTFGAEAAAQYHFKKSAKNLSRREAALLAALLPSPRKWTIKSAYVQHRARVIAARMNDVPGTRRCNLPAIQ